MIHDVESSVHDVTAAGTEVSKNTSHSGRSAIRYCILVTDTKMSYIALCAVHVVVSTAEISIDLINSLRVFR